MDYFILIISIIVVVYTESYMYTSTSLQKWLIL